MPNQKIETSEIEKDTIGDSQEWTIVNKVDK